MVVEVNSEFNMVIYTDESGNFGRAGRYFVMAALSPARPKRIKNLVKRCCVRFGSDTDPLVELKGYRMDFTERQEFVIKMLSRPDFQFSYIVVDKRHVNADLMSHQNIFFNYLASILLRPFIRNAEEDVQIIMDNRSRKVSHGNMLEQYLRMEACLRWNFRHNLDLTYEDSKLKKNIQAADVISNTVYQMYERSNCHCYRLLRPCLRHGHRFPVSRFGT